MRLKQTEKFRQDAVRIVLTSGLTRKQVADELATAAASPDLNPLRLMKILPLKTRRSSALGLPCLLGKYG